MDDLIKRKDAIDAVTFGITYAKVIDKETMEEKKLFERENEELSKAIQRIKEIPGAHAVPVKQGKWIGINNPNYSSFDGSCENLLCCSECGFMGGRISYEYCPLCGTKMEGVTE